MGQARTTNPYKKGSTNYNRVQAQINANKPAPGQITNVQPGTITSGSSPRPSATITYGVGGTTFTNPIEARKAQEETKQTTSQTTPKLTTSQTLTNKLNNLSLNPKTTPVKLNLNAKNQTITNTLQNQDTPTITNESLYRAEKSSVQQLLESQKYQTRLEQIKKLRFQAEKEAGLKTASPTTDLYNPEALSQRQIFYGEEKQASDQKQVDALNKEVAQFNTDYELFQTEYTKKDTDKDTLTLELSQKDYEKFIQKNQEFQDQKNLLDTKQQNIENLFTARTQYEETLQKIQDPIIKSYFGSTTPQSSGATAGITEFQIAEAERLIAGTPPQKAFAGQPKNLLTAILATPQIYSEQFKQTGTKTTTNPYLDNKFINPKYKNTLSTTTPIYTNIFEDQEIKDLPAPQTYEEELEFNKQRGFRAGLATAQDPYDIQDLTKDLETFRTDVAIGTVAGGAVGTIIPGLGTVAGATTGGLTGAIGGATNVITSNVVERQTGSEFLGESLGTITGIGAEIISAGAVSKAVAKTISANPRLIGNPINVAKNLGKNKLLITRYSKFKTGTGFLTRKFDVVDNVVVKRSDLLKNLSEEQTKAIFKQATKAPKYLTDDIFKSRIKTGTSKSSITKYTGEFAKQTKNTSLDDLLKKIDITEFEGVQRISVRTGRDLLIKAKTKIKPTIYDDSIENLAGFGQVREAEKAILIKKGTKTFKFEGYGLSYSEADELAEGIAKAQKGVKTTAKRIDELKLLGKSKYADIDAPEEIFKLNPKQTTTDLQEDVIFIKAKQKGSRLFTNEADEYSKFLSQTKEKGFSKTITFQGDETIISPTTKFKSDILTFSGNKGEGQIIRTSTKGIPDEFTLRIASKADDLPRGTQFTKATVTKTGDKIDDALGLNQVGIKPSKDIKLLEESINDRGKSLLQKDLEQAIIAYEKSANPTTLKNLQLLSTKIANTRIITPIGGANLIKAQKIEMNKKIIDFAKKGSPLTPEQNQAILDFSKKGTMGINKELTQISKDFSKKGTVGINKELTNISKDFSKKGTIGINNELTNISKDFAKKRGGDLEKIKPKTSVTNNAKPTDITDDFFKQLSKPKTKPVIKPDNTISTIKSSGGTLLLTKTKVKPVLDKATKTATKNITDTKTTNLGAKSQTATKSLTSTRTEYLNAKTRTSFTRAKTKQLFIQPQPILQTRINISKLQSKQKIGLKNLTQTKTKTGTKTKTLTDTMTMNDTMTLTDTKTATLQDTATLNKTMVATDTLTDTKTDTATATKTILITPTPTITPSIKTPLFKLPRIKLPFSNQEQLRPNNTKLYVSQVRVKNNSKWKTVSKPMPYNKSFNQGLDVADNTIGQSVRNVYKKTVKKYLPDDQTIKDYKFRNKKYKSKIPSNPVKIELRGFAIDTLGEKRRLSIAKYLAQKKAKNINKTFINNKGVKFL